MKDHYYRIETKFAKQYGIDGKELMLYCALRYYSSDRPCNKSIRQLAEDSCCGKKDAVAKILKELIAKGLVIEVDGGLTVKDNLLPENQTEASNNETEMSASPTAMSENETNLKESNKENIINNKEINQPNQDKTRKKRRTER